MIGNSPLTFILTSFPSPLLLPLFLSSLLSLSLLLPPFLLPLLLPSLHFHVFSVLVFAFQPVSCLATSLLGIKSFTLYRSSLAILLFVSGVCFVSHPDIA